MAEELTLEHGGSRLDVPPSELVRVGRSDTNTLVIDDPRVSREHLVVRHGPDGWVVENIGRSGMFVNGQRLDRLVLRQPTEIRLAAPDGPGLHFIPAPPHLDETILPNSETIFATAAPGIAPGATAFPRPSVPEVHSPAPAPPAGGIIGGEGASPPPSTPPSATLSPTNRTALAASAAVVLAVALYFFAAGIGQFWPFSSTAKGGEGGTIALSKLLPKDAVGCANVSANDLPKGFQGLVAGVQCDATNLPSAFIFAFQFDSPSDQKTSLSAFNSDVGYDPSQAASSCPPHGGSGDGLGTWSNNVYPTNGNQTLECFVGQNSNDSRFPIYLWSIPSQNAFVEAIAPAGSSFATLNGWWKSNAGPFH